jgi:hypothetical protein
MVYKKINIKSFNIESLNICVKGSHWFYISNFKSLYIFYKIIDDLEKTQSIL